MAEISSTVPHTIEWTGTDIIVDMKVIIFKNIISRNNNQVRVLYSRNIKKLVIREINAENFTSFVKAKQPIVLPNFVQH